MPLIFSRIWCMSSPETFTMLLIKELLERHDHTGILFDPPYSLHQVKECFDNIGVSLPFDTTQDASFGKVTKPLKESHYASYPKELIYTPIKASCPEFVCKKCGMPRVKIYKEQAQDNHSASKYQSKYLDYNYGQSLQGFVRSNSIATERESSRENAKELFPNNNKAQKEYIKFVHDHGGMKTAEFLDYTNCRCGVGFTQGIVLDMFMGSGTTAIVAKELGRRFIGCELNPDYIKIAQMRIQRLKGTQKTIERWGGEEIRCKSE